MGKLLAVWGSPNSGKTTLACAIAVHLAFMKKEVAVVMCDNTTPTISTVLPQVTNHVNATGTKLKSIGKIVSAVEFSTNDIYQQFVMVPNYKHLVLIGYAYGENGDSYATPVVYDVYDFYDKLSELVDYVIIDCTSDLLHNPLTTVGLEVAEAIVRTGGSTYKDLSFFTSQKPLFPGGKVAYDDHIIVFPRVKPKDAVEDIRGFYGNIDYKLSESADISRAMECGELLLKPYPPSYRAAVKKMVEGLNLLG